MRRRPLLLLAALATVAVGAAPAAAQAPPDPVVVTITTVRDDVVGVYTDCDGVDQPWIGERGQVELTRSGPTDAALTVTLEVTGDVEADGRPVTFRPGSATAGASVGSYSLEEGELTATVVPGDGYQVGDPSSAVVAHTTGTGPDCSDPLPLAGGDAEQTIRVGELPAPVQVDRRLGWGYSVVGDLPPGIEARYQTYDPEVTWTGAATTPGTYRFGLRHCFFAPDTLPYCDGTAPMSITVLAAGDAAPPAAPVSADARFTG